MSATFLFAVTALCAALLVSSAAYTDPSVAPSTAAQPVAQGAAEPDPLLGRISPSTATLEASAGDHGAHLDALAWVRMDPLLGVDAAGIRALAKNEPESLGSLSLGRAHVGMLLNPVQMSCESGCVVVDADNSWGTAETIAFLRHGIAELHRQYPASHPVFVGHISRKTGGYLRPHRSHQSGRDVDLGYMYRRDPKWYTVATADNLDVVKTWHLLVTFLRDTDVELVFMDRGVEALLRERAIADGYAPDWIQKVFDGRPGLKDAVIRHTWGHRTHMHVRFHNPVAQQNARRALGPLQALGRVPKRRFYSGKTPAVIEDLKRLKKSVRGW